MRSLKNKEGVSSLYNHTHVCGCVEPDFVSLIYDGTWKLNVGDPLFDLQAITNRAMRRVWKKQLKRGDLDKGLLMANYGKIIQGIQKGFGIEAEMSDGRLALYNKMRRNAFTFIAFKNHSNIADMVEALRDPKTGKLRTWPDFKRAGRLINQHYNVNWLQAEYQTAIASAQMADKWKQFEANKEFLPYLKYMTQNDSKVRKAHELLHGVVRHMDDSFWDNYFPPNGWRCRCYVLQSGNAEGSTIPVPIPDDKDVPQAFKGNPGKTGKMYNEKHPYFSIRGPLRGKVKDAMRQLKANDALAYQTAHTDAKTLSTVSIHMDADKVEQNLPAAKLIASVMGMDVRLAPSYGTPSGRSWPDFLIGSKYVAELKTIQVNSVHKILERIKKARKQHRNSLWRDRKSIVIIHSDNLTIGQIKSILLKVKTNLSVSVFGIIRNGKLTIYNLK